MGNEQGKKRRSKSRLLVSEITQIIDALDGSCNTDVSKGVNADVIQNFWVHELVPSLLTQYQKYLLPEANSKCTIEEFGELYVKIVRGSLDEKAETIAKIIGHSDGEAVTFDKVVKYVADLLESYLRSVERRKTREFISWQNHVDHINRGAIIAVAKNWCQDLLESHKGLTTEDLESWLHSCAVLSVLHRQELGMLYGLEPEDEEWVGMLPLLMNPEALGITKTCITPSQILHLNFLLQHDFQRQWRFLFSTNLHGESFSALLAKIVDKGPTIIIVVDEMDYVFGGFAPWHWTLSPKFRGDNMSFLFTLQPSVQVFPTTGYNDHYMYLNFNQQSMPNGLGMGGQFQYWGLFLDANFGEGECSDVCTTYRNYKMLSSQKRFTIKHLEVWGVGPEPLVNDDEERKPGILDSDATASKLLEMIDKGQHSSGIREPH